MRKVVKIQIEEVKEIEIVLVKPLVCWRGRRERVT